MKQIEVNTGKKINKKKTALTEYKEEKYSDLRQGKAYRVGKTETLDSMLTIQEGNKRHISTFIIDKGQDKDMAFATVQAVHPTTGQKIEDTVFYYFDSVKDIFLLEAIEKAEKFHRNVIQGFDDEGKPILKLEDERALVRRFIRFKYFAVRKAITLAARRALLKMMNREWRESEEVGFEKLEEEIVKNSIKDQQNNRFSTSATSSAVIIEDNSEPEKAQNKSNKEPEVSIEQTLNTLPQFPEPTDEELVFIEEFQEFLVNQSGGTTNVFPPYALRHLEDTAKLTALEFLIRDSTYHGLQYRHYQNATNPNVTQLTVAYPKGRNLTLFLNRTDGQFWIAKTTKDLYGDVLVPFLKATGYGKNWWFGPESTYQVIKETKRKNDLEKKKEGSR